MLKYNFNGKFSLSFVRCALAQLSLGKFLKKSFVFSIKKGIFAVGYGKAFIYHSRLQWSRQDDSFQNDTSQVAACERIHNCLIVVSDGKGHVLEVPAKNLLAE